MVTAVFFRAPDGFEPVLRVMETGSAQVVVAIRTERDEHLTLHRQADGELRLTWWSADKQPDTHDAARVAIAENSAIESRGGTGATTASACSTGSRDWTRTS